MKDISIGIYHKDHQYGKRLMEYLNHQKDFPMTASCTLQGSQMKNVSFHLSSDSHSLSRTSIISCFLTLCSY